MRNENLELGIDIIGTFFPPVAAGKKIYDFVKEENAKRCTEKLYWFAKNVRTGNIDGSAFFQFFANNEHFYGELLDVLNRLDTEDAVADFVKILNKFQEGSIDAELFRFFVYVITHWLLTDRDTMIGVWKDEGAPVVTSDMRRINLISIDDSIGHKVIEPLKRLVAYGLIVENVRIEINHNYDKRTSIGNEVNLKYTYIYQKEAMILCSILSTN